MRRDVKSRQQVLTKKSKIPTEAEMCSSVGGGQVSCRGRVRRRVECMQKHLGESGLTESLGKV